MKGAGPQILGTGAKFKRVPCQKSCRVNRALISFKEQGNKVLLLTYKALNNLAPVYISNLLF